MRHKLKAVFDDRGKAQQALDELLGSGYSSTDAALLTVPGASAGSAGDAPAPKWRERPGTSTARLLSRFFDHADSSSVRAAAGPGSPDSYILTLSTDSAAQAQRAASLLSGFMHTGSQDAGNAASGAQRGFAHADDAGRAAYHFGHDLHENDRYRNRSWHEARADLKALWEASDPDRPDWATSEAAVHLGWDSTRPEIDDDSYHRSHWRTRYASSATDATSSYESEANKASAVPDAAWKQRHPGELTAWENFMDALKHGWDRIRIGNDMDEADYRLHHANTYPGTNYDDLAPVYRYGHNVRRRTMFRNRSWDAVEDELRAEWERGHRKGKPATWDDMKAALHRGWDHVKA